MASFEGPLFIVGMPRSGTRLLRNRLRRHPKIRIPGAETEFFPWLVRVVSESGDLSQPKCFWRFYDDIIKLPYFSYCRDKGMLISRERWFSACRTFDAADIFEALIREEVKAPKGSGIIWGDKSPSYIAKIQLLDQSFSSARFIHIIRDVRDYSLSMHSAWGKDILRASQRWTDSVGRARQDGRSIGRHYTEIRYEDLLQNTEAELRRICRFLEIDFLDQMVDLDNNSQSVGDTRGQSRLVRDNWGKYLTRMDSKILRRVEGIGGEMLVQCGYELVFEPQRTLRITRMEMILAQLRDAWNRLLFERKKRGVGAGIVFMWEHFRATRHN